MVRTRASSCATTSDDPSRVEAPMAPPPSNTSADNPPQTTHQSFPILPRSTLIDRPAYEDIRSPYYITTADHPGLSLVTPSSIMYFDTTHEMWTVLNNRFNQGNGPRIFELNETLTYLNQGDDSVSAYFTKLTAIWDEIHQLRSCIPCTCAAATQHLAHQNQDQLLQFLKGLNDSYQAVRDQILLLDPCPALIKVFSMVINQERQRSLGHRLLPPMAASSSSTPQETALAANAASKNKRPRPHCTNCQKPGHYKDKCYFLIGFPPCYGNKKYDSNNTRKSDMSTTPNNNPQASQVTSSTPNLNTQFTLAQCLQLISICLAYASHVTPAAKLSSRARACAFLGYPPNMKAYTPLDLQTKKRFQSRDVLFYEHIYPFGRVSQTQHIDHFFSQTSEIHPSQSHLNPLNTTEISPSQQQNNNIPTSSPDISEDTTQNPEPSITVPPSRANRPWTKSGRVQHPPSYLKDYQCDFVSANTSTDHPLLNYISYHKFSLKF
uniref:CCHC-type domain-containing protein n=1 Tax=Cannabis sativa TaxID=3483 RepID=A0A803QCA7_CANSA